MPEQNIKTYIVDLERTQMHRETYIAILSSALTSRAVIHQYAKTLGISFRHLKQLLDPHGHQVPSYDLAYKISQLTPLAPEARSDLLHHLRSATLDSLEASTGSSQPKERLSDEQSRDVMLWIGNNEYHALYSTDPEIVHKAYRLNLKLGVWALNKMSAYDTPYHFAEITAALNRASNILNRPVSALWYAKLNLAIAQKAENWPETNRHWNLINNLVNGWTSISVTAQILGLRGLSFDSAVQAKQVVTEMASPRERLFLVPKVAQEMLNVFAITPGLPLKQVETIHEWGMNALTSSMGADTPNNIVAVMLDRNLVESYIRHNSRQSLRLAENHIVDKYSEDYLSTHGSLIHVMHLRTGANLSKKQHDQVSYRAWMARALEISREAGLDHQISEIQAETQGTVDS